ncbi:fused MFS/spermidine synthase [Nocardioides sp. Soil777]|uniref:fused MFS/spermidine synthase n=1 Tax=Nocardioides sp. Soil777 TaxID=1736409 RepID=UPI000A5EEEE3|nr:fused MFS/spermidine synthase [Nocardioides sp. Soil777]
MSDGDPAPEPTVTPPGPPPAPSTMGGPAAAALVFGSSAAVLVVELVALRLLAPYLGLTLETNTVVIGVALTAIAVGSWWGGRLADLVPARRLIGPLLLVSGVTVAATPFLVRLAAESADGSMLLLAAGLTLFVPGALLSAVTPAVTKLRLSSIAETGTVVGRLSGIGTAGAVVGTVVTGFVLVSRVPVTGIMVGLGLALVVAAVAVEARLRLVRGAAGASLVLVALGGLGGAVGPGGCDAETTYHCVVVEQDPERESGRVLVLDGLRHSYVDLDDATHLEFAYVQAIASAVDTALPGQEAVDAYHLGAGALTVPRYLDAVRPGSSSLVSEIDRGVVDAAVSRVGVDLPPDIEVRVEDGRLGLGRLGDDTHDLVVGDAFGGVSAPWHLATREAVGEVDRVLRDDGVYVANLIDHGPLGFARAEVATLASTFDHVALAADADTVGRTAAAGGNLVALASDRPLDTAAWQARLDERGTDWRVITGRDLRSWVDGADVLTDELAPVDQLLTPYPVA